MKNLVVFHLESISRQRLAAFARHLPHTLRLMEGARVYDHFYASATSTAMVMTYLFHANDFEYDTASAFEGMRANRNNPHLFAILRDAGYHAHLICLNGFEHIRPIRLEAWSDVLGPLWGTGDFPALVARFDALTDKPPFALYVWDLITHIEHSLALAAHANGLTDQIRRACAAADDALGAMCAILERKRLLQNTTIVAYGDHGDDPWTHGFKGGVIHGTEPYTGIVWTPLAIRDPALPPGVDDAIASTIDIAPTCFALLGIDAALPFVHSGVDLARGGSTHAHSQNFTANQPDSPERGIAQAFAVTDRTHTLLASSRGLQMYAHRLDPGNHCNLLHFFDLAEGRLALRTPPGAAGHFRAGWQDNARAVEGLRNDFERLRAALTARIAAKRAYIAARGVAPVHALDPSALDTIDREGRESFFHRPPAAGRPSAGAMPAFEFSYKLR
jgi:hypothetical protein